MFDFLKRIKVGMLGSAVITVVLGLILVINPIGVVETLCSLFGWLLFLMGVLGLCNYFIFSQGMSNLFELGVAVIEVLIGIYVILRPKGMIEIVSFIMAVILLVHGLHDMDMAMQMKRSGYERWWWTFGIAVVTILLGVLVFVKPFTLMEIPLRVIGAIFLFDGVSDLWIVYKTEKVARNVKEKAEPIDVDAKIR